MLQCHSVFNSKYLHYALLGFQSRFLSPFYRDYWTKLIFAVIRKPVDTRMYITLLINYANALVYSSQNRNLKCLYFVCFLIWSDCIWYQHNCLLCIAINITVILRLFLNQDLQLKLLCSQCNFPNMVSSSWFFFFGQTTLFCLTCFGNHCLSEEIDHSLDSGINFSMFDYFSLYIIQGLIHGRDLERVWNQVSLKLREEREVVCRSW